MIIQDRPLPSEQERISYYLGSILATQRPGSVYSFRDHPTSSCHRVQTTKDLEPIPGEPAYAKGYDRRGYDIPLLKLLRQCGMQHRSFLYAPNDRVGPDKGPCLVKNRRESTEPVILRCFNHERHWGDVFTPDPLEFEEKKDIVFWRGTSSGWEFRPPSRVNLVKRWGTKEHQSRGIDIGFSNLSQEYALPGIRERWEPFVKNSATIAESKTHKYLISAEGNDKDSGLNWKLASNSLVLMARPRCHSWLMESWLQPFVHYVPLLDDFSDLDEKRQWCIQHPDRCVEIIGNAHHFMQQFRNTRADQALERQVIRTYFRRIQDDREISRQDRCKSSTSKARNMGSMALL